MLITPSQQTAPLPQLHPLSPQFIQISLIDQYLLFMFRSFIKLLDSSVVRIGGFNCLGSVGESGRILNIYVFSTSHRVYALILPQTFISTTSPPSSTPNTSRKTNAGLTAELLPNIAQSGYLHSTIQSQLPKPTPLSSLNSTLSSSQSLTARSPNLMEDLSSVPVMPCRYIRAHVALCKQIRQELSPIPGTARPSVYRLEED